jgi:hypothetical protein
MKTANYFRSMFKKHGEDGYTKCSVVICRTEYTLPHSSQLFCDTFVSAVQLKKSKIKLIKADIF